MRISSTIKKTQMVMQADMESTHNFLSTGLAEQLGHLGLEPDQHTAFEVLVANGEGLFSKGKCSAVQVWLQVTLFTLEFFLIDLRGYDSVLGAQWLKTLGPILWDFSKLYMSLTWQAKEVMLVGLAAPKNKLVEGPKMLKELRRQNEGVLLQLFVVQLGVDQQCPYVEAPELQQLLEVFQGLFAEPQGLLPVRPQDHKIQLCEGSSPVNVHPYKYPHY